MKFDNSTRVVQGPDNPFALAVALFRGEKDVQVETEVELRDPVIKYVLSLFKGQAVKVFQVGAIESLQSHFRCGSGWSDTIFGSYIKHFGGELTVVDIDLDHIANSNLASYFMGYDIHLTLGDAIEYIKEGYDIYYLDGADGEVGNKQTLEQFKKIENTSSVVLVDDIQSKGPRLIKYLESKGIDYETHNVGNGGMITIDMRWDK